MKNCKTCNAVLDDTAAFCVMCGAKIEGGIESELAAPPVPSQIDYMAVLAGEEAKASPRQVFFNATSSTKALITVVLLAIGFAVSVIVNFVAVFNSANIALARLVLEGQEMGGIMQNVTTGGLSVLTLLMLMPTFFTMLGVIFTYLSSKNRRIDTRGLTFMKATSIFSLVIYGLLVLLIAFLLAIYTNNSMSMLIVGTIGAMIGISAPVIVHIFFLTTIDKMKKVVRFDQNYSIPTAVPIMIIISCGITVLTGLSGGNFVNVVLSGFAIVGNIMFALCLFDYNNELALMRVKNIYDKPANRGTGL